MKALEKFYSDLLNKDNMATMFTTPSEHAFVSTICTHTHKGNMQPTYLYTTTITIGIKVVHVVVSVLYQIKH